jgi:outer membrane protein TolC
MNKKTSAGTALTLVLVSAAGCANPFAPVANDYGPRLPLERIRTVEMLEMDGFAVEERTPEELAEEVLNFAGQLVADAQVDLTIEEARALTLRNNLDLRVALINPEISATRISTEESAWEALFYFNGRVSQTDRPTPSAISGGQIDSQNFNAGVQIPLLTGGQIDVDFLSNRVSTDDPVTFLDPSIDSELGASLSQPLLRNAGRRANTHQLRVASLQYGIDSARTKLELIAQLASVERGYWLLYAFRRELDVRLQEYELAVAQLERARRRVRAGSDAEVEVIRAESGVAERLEAIIIAQNGVLNQQRELKRVMNAPDLPIAGDTLLIPISDPDPVEYQIDAAPLLEAAVVNRMELLEIELQLLIDASTVDLRRNETLMRLDFDAGYNMNGLDDSLQGSLQVMREDNFADWTFGLSGEVPLGNEFARSRLREAVLTRLQRLGTRDARRQSIEQEVLDAVVRIQADWRRVLAARQSSILAARTLQAEQRQFDVGRRTSTDVLDAAATLADAQSAEIRALTDYQITQLDLATATGTLLGASRIDWDPIDPSTVGDEAPRRFIPPSEDNNPDIARETTTSG